MTQDDFDPEPWMEDIRSLYRKADPAHDFSHALRVCRNARIIGREEGADTRVLLFAALLHDVGSEKGKKSEQVQAEGAGREAVRSLLACAGLDAEEAEKVLYAVEVHRFSRGIVPVTLEAKILQDADRLDALGAIGIARLFVTGGVLGRDMYHPQDPFCQERKPDDGKWNLDHFYQKLLKLESGMHTAAGQRLAERRTEFLRIYLRTLEEEISAKGDPGKEDCAETLEKEND